MQYAIVYNLFPYGKHLILPNAYITEVKPTGELTYIQHKATVDTISGFGLELTPERHKLFDIIEELQEKNLEEKFMPKGRKKYSLEKLLNEKKTRDHIVQWVHRKMDGFFNILSRHQFPLCWNVERKVLLEDLRIYYPNTELVPKFYFRKTDDDVRYRFWFQEGDHRWHIRTREVLPLTNMPAWLLVNDQLHQVDGINGNMVQPFLKKDEVVIPEKHVKTYFQSFIRKVAARANIQADGFGLRQHKKLLSCKLEAVQDFLQDSWKISLRFVYPKIDFEYHSKVQQRTMLEFDEDEEVILHRTSRNERAESLFVEKLQEFGLEEQSGYFHIKNPKKKDSFYPVEWLSQNQKTLQEAGFEVVSPSLEGQPIALYQPTISTDIGNKQDWFDLKIVIEIGEERIPFQKIAPHIRDENRVFPLPSGSVFIIPEEWFARFRGLAQFGRMTKENIRLEKSQFTVLKDFAAEEAEEFLHSEVAEDLDDFQVSEKLKAELRPYQLEGVRWMVNLYQQGLGACLADDMGLGKTLQTIAVLLFAKEKRAQLSTEGITVNAAGSQLGLFGQDDQTGDLTPLNALIVLPASLVFNWEQEIRKFAPSLQVYKYVGNRQKDIRILQRFDVLLTTYHTALRDKEILGQLEFEYIVLDESQQIKNKNSKIFAAVNSLQARHKISLSGTPIENSLADLWAQMQFINPKLLGSYRFFQQEFITPIEKQQDEEKKLRLRTLVQPFLLRRTKEEVAKELPELHTQLFYSEMSKQQEKLYEKEKSAARNYLLENYQSGDFEYSSLVIQTLLRLRQIACHPVLFEADYKHDSGKFSDILEYFEVLRRGGRKVLAFSNFTKHLELFKQHFDNKKHPYAWLTGDTPQQKRQQAIERFQQDEQMQTFFISMKAGGTGLNLTAADYVCILDPWWNPATEQQAIARAHRIGQTKPVIAVKFITKNTIEEKILKLQEQKAQLAEDIIENRGKVPLSKQDIAYLFE